MGFFLPGVWFSSWYVVSIDTGHIAQSPQSSPRWRPAFKREPVLSVSSFRVAGMTGPVRSLSSRVFSVTRQRQNSRGTNPNTLRSCWLISYWPNQIPCPSSRIKVGEEAGGNLYLHESTGAGGGSRGDQQGHNLPVILCSGACLKDDNFPTMAPRVLIPGYCLLRKQTHSEGQCR